MATVHLLKGWEEVVIGMWKKGRYGTFTLTVPIKPQGVAMSVEVVTCFTFRFQEMGNTNCQIRKTVSIPFS